MLVEEQFALYHSEPTADIPGVDSVAGKVIKRSEGEMMFMGWVMERVRMGEMWRPNLNPPARLADSVQLLHGPNNVREMLEDITKDDAVESALLNRPGKALEIIDDVDAWIGPHINPARGPRVFGISTSNIKNFHHWGILDKHSSACKGFVQ